MLDNITKAFQSTFRTLRGRGRLSENNINDAIHEIKMSLLAADVNVGVVKEFISEVKNKALGEKVLKSLTPDQQFIKIVNDELVSLMGEAVELDLAVRPPVVIMCVGLQGSGKTTTAAKLARYIAKKGKRPFLVPADLKRPAAIEQLTVLGKSLNIEVFASNPGGDPASTVSESLEFARGRGFDVVIIDTAGRLHIDDEMMKEVGLIEASIHPHHTLFVADAMTGQDAVRSSRAFSEALNLTGVILTKLDGDAKGGAALSIRKVTGRPILFAGVGERVEDLEEFRPDRMVSRILGMGDVLSLIETATESVDNSDAAMVAERMVKGRFTLDDLKEQFRAVKKMGSMGKIVNMLPGAGAIKEKLSSADMDRELKRKEAIINSMTLAERRNPKILNGSRRKRIALGSGSEVSDVNRLLREFEAIQKMMKRFGKGGIKNIMNMFGG